MSVSDSIQSRIKVRAYKNLDNPDGRVSICGESVQICPETGREFFEVPGHQREYLQKLMTGYDFTDEYEVDPSGKPVVSSEQLQPKTRVKKTLPKVG